MPYPSWIYWRKKCMSKIICVFRSINCVFTIVQICFATNSWFWTWEQVSSDFVLLQTYSMADHTVKRHQITIKQMHCYCYCCWVLVNDGRAGWSRTCFSYCPLKMWQGALNQTTWSHFQDIADGLISFAQSHWFGCYKILKKTLSIRKEMFWFDAMRGRLIQSKVATVRLVSNAHASFHPFPVKTLIIMFKTLLIQTREPFQNFYSFLKAAWYCLHQKNSTILQLAVH